MADRNIPTDPATDFPRNHCPFCGRGGEKLVTLRGQPWLVSDDGYRFWLRPATGNPLVDREPRYALEYKHNDSPASELAELMFRHLPNEVRS